jgi:ATP-dependent helicase HepA
MNAFEQVFPAGSTIKQAVDSDLMTCLLNPTDHTALAKLIEKTHALTKTTLDTLQKGRNRLLELNSCNQSVATEVVEELEETSNSAQLTLFMDIVFDEFGVEQQAHSADSVILEPGNHMLHHQFPGLPEDGVTATYKRHRALVREDMAFLSWEHPMVLGSLDLITHSDFGNSAFCTLSTDALPAGTLLIEAIFTLKCSAPKSLQLGRYLTESYLRLVIDEKGNDYTHLFEQDHFNLLAGRIPRATAQELIRHARPQITNLITQSKNKSTPTEKQMIKAALAKIDKNLDNEISRLVNLSKVNSNIRSEEIQYLENTKLMLKETIATGKLGLDALRIAITTEPK